MIAVARKLRTPTQFIVSNLGCAAYQVLTLVMLTVVEGLTGFFFGGFFWKIDQTQVVGDTVLPLIGEGVFLSGLYAVLWLIFWEVTRAPNGNIRWFYWKVVFSTLPYLLALAAFDPIPNPMAMIPTPHAEYQFIFSCLVTGFLMFPLYSITLYKYVLQRSARRFMNSLNICAVILAIGTGIFITAWNTMQFFYHLQS